MESLGKKEDLDGKVVHQGIAVDGNKGSTDQHAYVQQLRDGVPNFFATFLEVRKDYLQGFLRGTRVALSEGDRDSITVSISEVDAFQVGALIALYERAVGFYGSLVNVNADHQPGVEAGKKAATRILQLQPKVLGELSGSGKNADAIAQAIGADPEDVYHVREWRSTRRRDVYPR